MADLRPFRAIRYTPAAGSPADLAAPPYDVIGPEEHLELCRRSPHNIVRLDLGERTSPLGNLPADWYGDAAMRLAAWQEEGILQTDPEPALYLYTQTFGHRDRSYRRKLVLGALRLEPYENGRVLPHENTLPGPKADRLRLMQATGANLSPILGFFPDDDGRVNDCLEAFSGVPAAVDFTDGSAVRHELRVVTDRAAQEELSRLVAPRNLYIADGHHRYETSLAYQRLRREQAPAQQEPMPYDYLLAACMSSADPGLVIRPTHRMVRWEGAPWPAEVLRTAEEWFSVTPLAVGSPEAAVEAAAASGGIGPFVLYAGGRLGYALLELRDESALSGCPYPASSAARRLAATVFGHGFVPHALSPAVSVEVSYTSDSSTAVRSVGAGTHRLAALLPGVAVEQLMAVVNAGERMPPKSTYFWPKPLTGIVLRSLDSF
jgi:uncharacterized protein (DUF1015 family)